MIVDPPSLSGTLQAIVTVPELNLAKTDPGASGVVELTTVKVAGLEVALPALERATASKRYPL